VERIRHIAPPTAVAVGGMLTLAGALLVAFGLIGGMRSEWPPISPALPTPLAAALVAAGVASLLAAPVLVAVASGRPGWVGAVGFLGGIAIAAVLLAAIWVLVSFEAAVVSAPVLGGGIALVAAGTRGSWWRRTAALSAVAVAGGVVAHVLGTGAEIVVVVCWTLAVLLLARSTPHAPRSTEDVSIR
jgi:hypothetical protein